MTQPKVLIFDKKADWYAAELASRCPGFDFHAASDEESALAKAADTEILIGLAPLIPPKVIAGCTRLQWIQALTTGIDNLAGMAEIGPDVAITNCRGIHGRQMSELAILLMMALARRFPAILANQKEAAWERWEQPVLAGRTICLLGLGAIAETLAGVCNAFGMTVTGVSDSRSSMPGLARIYRRDELPRAAAEADFMVVLIPLSSNTRNIVDADVLAAMKPDAFIINMARGGVVNEAALIEALDARNDRRRRSRRLRDRAAARRQPVLETEGRDRHASYRRPVGPLPYRCDAGGRRQSAGLRKERQARLAEPAGPGSRPMSNSPISRGEMERRWTATRAAMEEHGIDALVTQAREDWCGGYVRWLTDIPANNGYPRTVVVFPDRPMTVIEMGAFDTDILPDPDLQDSAGVGRVLGTPSFVSVNYTIDYDTKLLIGVLKDAGARRVGLLAPEALPHSIMKGLAESGFETVDMSDPIDRVKAIKSEEEKALIRRTAELQDKVFAEVCDFIAPGRTDRDVAAHAEAAARQFGSDQGILLGLSAPLGSPSRFKNRPFQSRPIQDGDHMSLLIEVNGPGGLYLEIARTMVLGKADDHLLEAFDHVRAAQDHTLSLMKPGAAPSDIAAAHDRWMEERGLPPETRLYAHGQGCDMVERPLLRRDETMPIAEDMHFAVHPGFDDGRVFAVICDNYLIGPEGPGDCLHQTEKRIFEL